MADCDLSQFITVHDGKWVDVNRFCESLKPYSHNIPTEKVYLIWPSRIIRGVKDPTRKTAESTYVTLRGLLIYLLQHEDETDIFSSLCKEVLKVISSSCNGLNIKVDASVLTIYQRAAKEKFFISTYLSLIEESQFEENAMIMHKDQFTDVEWKQIVLFEHHFALQQTDNHAESSYEETLEAKQAFLNSLIEARKLGISALNASKTNIKIRQRQKEKRASELDISVCGHTASTLEKTAFEYMSKYCNVANVTFVQTTDLQTSASTHCFLTYEDEHVFEFNDICYLIAKVIKREHSLFSFIFVRVPNEMLQLSKGSDGTLSRYKLRQLANRDASLVVYPLNLDPDDQPDDVCKVCDSEKQGTNNYSSPVEKWIFSVPINLQLFLQPFVNIERMGESKEPAVFLAKKTERLFALYEKLLNIYSKNYIGETQEKNTEKLVMGYKSASTVFDVTSKCGATLSYSAAEQHLKKLANEDRFYHDAYLRAFDLNYETAGGVVTKPVGLKDCYKILMLDNLVRLRYVSEPDRGECRSRQMNTLPITIQGLPKDNLETHTWHKATCDNSYMCECKISTDVIVDDVSSCLFTISDEEKDVFMNFEKLCVWENKLYWKTVGECELLSRAIHTLSTTDDSQDGTSNADVDCELRDFDLQLNQHEQHCDSQVNFDDSDTEDTEQSLADILVRFYDKERNTVTHKIANSEHTGVQIGDMTLPSPSLSSTSLQTENSFLNSIFQETDDSFLHSTFQEEEVVSTVPLPQQFGLTKYRPPPLLTRHPKPYIGRDDDVNKLREILDDILANFGLDTETNSGERILFGPDHKLSDNLFKLIKGDCKYEKFIPEFPCLHFRKSKINTLFSAYKDAGLLEIMQYMRDDGQEEWTKLITAEHIDVATKHMMRLSKSLHISFMISFLTFLSPCKAQELFDDLLNQSEVLTAQKWHSTYQKFFNHACEKNATFALHADILKHLDHIRAIHLAERLGGSHGHQLLRATTKNTLTFGFVNGAKSYAPFSVQLLYHHHKSGYFYQKMKQALFSTPLKGGSANLATDTKRELEHQDAIQGFRTGSSLDSVLRRLSLVDQLSETSPCSSYKRGVDKLGWQTSKVDLQHIQPTVELIQRRGGLVFTPDVVPKNVYSVDEVKLPEYILDRETDDIGHFLIYKYLAQENLFKMAREDVPPVDRLKGPKSLLQKVKLAKGITLKRMTTKKVQPVNKGEWEMKEENRKKKVAAKVKQVECLSSHMNMCQALVKPDCSKPKVQKANTMLAAFTEIILNFPSLNKEERLNEVQSLNLISIGSNDIRGFISQHVKFLTVEFAGVKFKTNANSGKDYLAQVESTIRAMLLEFPGIQNIVICEENYAFTPDDFKANTRQQRQKKAKTLSHLRRSSDLLSSDNFDKYSLTSTAEGKAIISTFLADNVSHMKIKRDFILDIDSELHMSNCACEKPSPNCSCRYSSPIRAHFSEENGFQFVEVLNDIQQRKGEAEMSQFDWVIEYKKDLQPGEAIVSIVSSGDIDALYIHLYGLSRLWPRKFDGTFQNEVYLILEKPGKRKDIFHVTKIIQHLEDLYAEQHFVEKICLFLCIGGNDFIPKMHGFSHSAVIGAIFKLKIERDLFIFEQTTTPKIQQNLYLELIKKLYCEKRKDPATCTYEDIQHASKFKKNTKQARNVQSWMPPESAMLKVAQLINLQAEYLHTAGNHNSHLPDFLGSGVLIKTAANRIEYDFGEDSFLSSPLKQNENEEDCETPMKNKKRMPKKTPEKRSRRKLKMTTNN